jgi:peroxiredoxin Q/BCP
MKQPPYTAPKFTLKDENGQEVSLDDFAGKWVVLYFYPKDDTPGCTMQACSLRDVYDDLADAGAIVLGVSKDDQDSHKNFAKKHKLNFSLLSDESGTVLEQYGAWGKKMFGKEGILRKTFIIDPKGVVQKVYGRAIPAGHGESVLESLKELQNNS